MLLLSMSRLNIKNLKFPGYSTIHQKKEKYLGSSINLASRLDTAWTLRVVGLLFNFLEQNLEQ